ncbi:MAG: AAA family ATPase, partial [Bryobacteraceae bacterium]
MLLELVIENYAVVDRLRIRFQPGLNLLTGETGSGKSIVVDALGLLLGARASADTIRSGESRARISGIFSVPEELRLEDYEIEEGELLVEREILAGGKSRAYVGSRPATAALLRDLAPRLGDIHGQHDQQLLFSADAQRAMLDTFAGASTSPVGDLYRRWTACTKELEAMERSEQEKLRLLDLWNFQRREIEAASPQAGEDTALDEERRVLMNLGRLQESTGIAFAALYDSPESALAMVRAAMKRLDDMGRIDSSLAAIRETLEPAAIAIEEASFALRDYLSNLEASPGRLEEIETRLDTLDKLKRKYGASLAEVLLFLQNVQSQISAVENAGERMAALRGEREALA